MIWIAKPIKETGTFLITLFLFLTGGVFFLWCDNSAIVFESLESKTGAGKPVYNKISFHPSADSETWLMEQSHLGLKASKEKWAKIAIVVKKKSRNQTAEFYQLMPGTEDISMNLKPIGLKASCFLCHSNGPRAIRPNYDSEEVKVSFWNKARITLWNFKIKSYGPMNSVSPVSLGKVFRYDHPKANRELKVKSCTRCHNSESFFGRGPLTKQNFMTIKFMIDHQLMPPKGHRLEKKDLRKIQEFVRF